MKLLTRIKSLFTAKAHTALDNMEDPIEMIELSIKESTRELETITMEHAKVIAESKALSRRKDELSQEVSAFENRAKEAVKSGNDEDALKLLNLKSETVDELELVSKSLQSTENNASKILELQDKCEEQIKQLKLRKRAVITNLSVAKTQESVTKLHKELTNKSTSKIVGYEEAAQRRVDIAEASMELEIKNNADDELCKKYDSNKLKISEELEAMKANLGTESEKSNAKVKSATKKA